MVVVMKQEMFGLCTKGNAPRKNLSSFLLSQEDDNDNDDDDNHKKTKNASIKTVVSVIFAWIFCAMAITYAVRYHSPFNEKVAMLSSDSKPPPFWTKGIFT